MEKIQSAIAKARASRTGQDHAPHHPAPGPAPGPAPAGTADHAAPGAAVTPLPGMLARSLAPEPGSALAAADPAGIAAAWEALPAFSPPAGQMARHHIVTFAGGAAATPFDVLRTRLVQRMRANNWKRLAITSPTPGCGKSTLALNLAFSLARQPELRTVLGEIDLRRPSLARMLGLRMQHNFARVLDGSAPFSDHAARHGANLAVAANHASVSNAAELLQGSSVGRALARIEAVYDPAIMIFDLPPMLAGDDAMAFVRQVDCVLLLAAAGASTIKEIDNCERDLATQTNVLGVVLNKCRYMDRPDGYGYYG